MGGFGALVGIDNDSQGSGRFGPVEGSIVTNRERLYGFAEGVRAPADLAPETLERGDFERVQATLYLAVVAESVPRRLGRDADSQLLAIDKRIARKLANAYRSMWMAYARAGDIIVPDAPVLDGREARMALAREADQDARRAGATVRWSTWFRSRREDLIERRAVASSVAVREGIYRWGVRRVRVIEQEIDNIERVADEAARRLRR